MYTVLLVDDEANVIKSLQQSIDWENLGVEKILVAYHGIEALEIMESEKVDLLITDIRMPKMNGLKLLQHVRAEFPETHCILLTAYGEFDYAKQAIQLGVENYLLKPFNKNELEETIEKAFDNIYIRNFNSKYLFRNNVLRRWISGSIDDEELSERSNILGINTYLAEYVVLCMTSKGESSLPAAFCTDVTTKLLETYETYDFRDGNNRYVAIVGGSKIALDSLLHSLNQRIEKHQLESIARVAIGCLVEESSQVNWSYQTAINLLETPNVSEEKTLVCADKVRYTQKSNGLLKMITSIFHESDEEKRSKDIYTFAEKIYDITETENSSQALTLLSNAIYQAFMKEFPSHPGLPEEVLSRLSLFLTTAREDISDLTVEILEHSYLLYSYYFEQLSPIVQLTIHHVHEKYATSLSLKEVSKINKMNPAYLGYLFKQETGMFFNNYLAQHRISCAIQMMKDTDKRIQEIAKEVGFSSTSYFITCFRKQIGMSPANYKSLQLMKSHR